ncbi:MAG: class C sortase [Lachnospiraceae bacterium]|nr:class C sortase [Lachnospiraceae bacterium]
MKKYLPTILIALMFITGVALMAYPSVSNYWNSLHATQVVSNYSDAVENLDDDAYEELLEAARSYNEALAESQDGIYLDEEELETYESMLDITGDGVMGYITIEKIDVYLPIYHGTSSAVLMSGVGHIDGTSLPIGGESTHCVLSGHRGMPSALLFTNLDKLEVGDTFTLTVLDEEITYEVDLIQIVEPNETASLYIEDGEDYCTLVTCTPYGINTQRLLVRGKRTTNTAAHIQVSADAEEIAPVLAAPFVALPLILASLLIYLAICERQKKRSILQKEAMPGTSGDGKSDGGKSESGKFGETETPQKCSRRDSEDMIESRKQSSEDAAGP